MTYVIVSEGRVDCRGAHVVDAAGEIARFATRAEALARLAEVRESTPSKYEPIVVRELDPDVIVHHTLR